MSSAKKRRPAKAAPPLPPEPVKPSLRSIRIFFTSDTSFRVDYNFDPMAAIGVLMQAILAIDRGLQAPELPPFKPPEG